MNRENGDFRKKYILHPGDTIASGQTEYTITDDFVAYGGSAVIYSCSESSKENPIKCVIKEVFPNEDRFERLSGIIRPYDPENMGELKWYREHIAEEHKLGGLCYNETNLAVPIRHIIHPDKITIDGKEYTEDIQDGVFAVLDDLSGKAISFAQMLEYIKQPKSEDHPLRNGGCPTLHTTACLIEQVLLTLRAIHNNGVLFGDIHMDNVWFSKDCLELGIIHTSCFMDFGCSRPLIDGKRTDIIKGRIFSSKGFTPPELLPDRWAQGDGTISIQADIFSVGCLMLRCLFPDEYWDHFGKSPVIGPRTLQRDDMKRLGIDNALRKKTNDILAQAMNPDLEKRYLSADLMLMEIQSLIEHLRPPKNQLNLGFSTLAPGEFRGREEEMKEIDRRISEHRKPIELYGFGGMGKSELAIEYCRRKMESAGVHVHFVRFDKTMRNTVVGPIADAFSGYSRFTEQGEPKSEQLIYSEVMKMLGEQDEEDILCIDNVDNETEEFADLYGKEYTDLCRLKMNLIITTRFDRKEFGGIEVGALQRKHLYNLMAHILKDTLLTLTENEMDELIQIVDSNTLAIELIAKTLKYSVDISPDFLLSKLKECDYSSSQFAKVSSAKDRDFRKRRIDVHLQCLFDIANLPNSERNQLQHVALAETNGLDYTLFSKAYPDFNVNVLNHLIERGWLSEGMREYTYRDKKTDILKTAKKKIIFIHPLILAMLLNARVEKTEEHTVAFLNNLWKIALIELDDIQIKQIRNCFSAVHKYFPTEVSKAISPKSDYLDLVVESRDSILKEFLHHNSDEQSLDVFIKRISSIFALYPVASVGLASIYHRAAVVYYLSFKSYKKAIECEERAVELTDPNASRALVKEYRVLGKCYGYLGKNANAIDCYLLAYHNQCIATSEDHPDNAELLSDLALYYIASGNGKDAFYCLKKAMNVWEICLHNSYPNTLLDRPDGRVYVAMLYRKLATLSKEIGDNNAECTYAAKAEIVEMDNAEFPYLVFGRDTWCGIPTTRIDTWKSQFQQLSAKYK